MQDAAIYKILFSILNTLKGSSFWPLICLQPSDDCNKSPVPWAPTAEKCYHLNFKNEKLDAVKLELITMGQSYGADCIYTVCMLLPAIFVSTRASALL